MTRLFCPGDAKGHHSVVEGFQEGPLNSDSDRSQVSSSMALSDAEALGLAKPTSYQPPLPGPPLKGPAKSGVIQPP